MVTLFAAAHTLSDGYRRWTGQPGGKPTGLLPKDYARAVTLCQSAPTVTLPHISSYIFSQIAQFGFHNSENYDGISRPTPGSPPITPGIPDPTLVVFPLHSASPYHLIYHQQFLRCLLLVDWRMPQFLQAFLTRS